MSGFIFTYPMGNSGYGNPCPQGQCPMPGQGQQMQQPQQHMPQQPQGGNPFANCLGGPNGPFPIRQAQQGGQYGGMGGYNPYGGFGGY